MHYLPALLALVQHTTSSIQEALLPRNERSHRDIPEAVYSHFFRLNVYLWGCGFAARNFLEHGLERLLDSARPGTACG
jgi:hypothetical protein